VFNTTATVMILPCFCRLLLVFVRANLLPTTSNTKISICSSRFKSEAMGALVPNNPDIISAIQSIH
jgi:hypothetical protein